MSAPYAGLRVLEVAEWTFVPAAAAVLAEFGADVVKIERPQGGDAQRGLAVSGFTPTWNGVSLQMEASNRGGKRSVGIDIRTPGGLALLYRLVEGADVFLTSFLPKARQRLKIEPEDLHAINPRLIYGYGHGLGPQGPDAEKGGYDLTSYWARSGVGYALTEDGAARPVFMRPAFGDRLGAMNLVAGVSAALVRRAGTGDGAVVEASLLSTGLWQIAHDVVYSLALDIENSRILRGRNPLSGYYATSDGRWITLALLESDRWWKDFAEAIGAEHLLEDPRFFDHAARDRNYEECCDVLAQIFAARSLGEWRDRLAGFRGPWEPMQSVHELSRDPQVLANGYLGETVTTTGDAIPNVPAPFKLAGVVSRLDGCPEPGAHTEEVLLELGLSWDDLTRHKDAGEIS